MKITADLGDERWVVDLDTPRDISVRLDFDGAQPDAFGIAHARAEAFRAGDFVADTTAGGSVNCKVIEFCPHSNGTHTECVGHIVDDPVAIADILEDTLVGAWVVTLTPRRFDEAGERYDGLHAPDDLVVTAADLGAALENCPAHARALVVRTAPNPPTKRHTSFTGSNPAYPTNDAMRLIRERDFKHLLVDLPSVDREDDGGRVTNHRIFWDIADEARHFHNVPSAHTITEMIYVPDDVADGFYFLTIQIPDFVLDAAPSRVRLFTAHLQR